MKITDIDHQVSDFMQNRLGLTGGRTIRWGTRASHPRANTTLEGSWRGADALACPSGPWYSIPDLGATAVVHRDPKEAIQRQTTSPDPANWTAHVGAVRTAEPSTYS